MKITELPHEVAKDEEIIDVTIYRKDGEPYLAADGTPATIGVVGSEAKDYRRAEDAISRRMLRMGRRSTPDDLRENRIAQHAACVRRWHGWEDDYDADVPCTPENVKTLLGAAEHILDQVVAGVIGHASFFAKSSSS